MLKYRRWRCDMIVYKTIANKQDSDVTLKFNIISTAVTKRQYICKDDLCKFSFSNRVTILWKSLPDTVVKAKTVNSFKERLDRYWNEQKVKFNRKAYIHGTGSRSNIA